MLTNSEQLSYNPVIPRCRLQAFKEAGMTQAMAGTVANAGGVYVMLLCIGMVALYAFNRYNTPATNITTTTARCFI
jgi:hypothetical protein